MFTTSRALCLALACFATTPAQALEFKGAELDFGYSTLEEDRDFRRVRLRASGEVGFGPMFGLQLDYTLSDYNILRSETYHYALHAIFTPTEALSLGLFGGEDESHQRDFDDQSIELYGVEAKYDFGRGHVEAHYIDYSSADVTSFGVEAKYQVRPNLVGGARLYRADLNEFDQRSDVFAASVEYSLDNGVRFYGEVGSDKNRDPFFSERTTFITLGVRLGFGPNGRTTFGSRSYFDYFEAF